MTKIIKSDAELVTACLNGEETAWNTLIERYQSLIYSVPFKYGFSKADADEIFSAVCMILLDKLPDLRDQNRLGSWLLIIVQRECWRLQRKANRETVAADLTLDRTSDDAETALDLQTDGTPLPEEQLVRSEEYVLIHAAMAAMDKPCRDLLNLLYFSPEPLSYEEIARRLNMAEGSVGPTRARCLKKLRTYLEKNGF